MKKFACLLALLVALPVVAADGRYIVDLSASKLYVYNDAGDELDELRASAVKKDFAAIPGNSQKGIAIMQEDEDEGLLQVKLSKYDDPVWVETMAVKTWPSERLKCPEVTQGRPEVAQAGMTIGFGEHCEPGAE